MKMPLRRLHCRLAAASLLLFATSALAGTSCRDGVARALQAPASGIAIDGDLSDWDQSAPVLCWNADARAYLFDRQSQVVSDLPNEVRVCPANWGAVQF